MPTDAGSTPAVSTNNKTPTVLGWGFFLRDLAGSHVFLGGSCGSLRTSPAARIGRSGPHSTLSWPFLAPTSLPGTGPKFAKAATQAHTDQRVTRGRIKRLDCCIGYRSGQTSLAQSQQSYRAFYSIWSNSFCAASLAAASCAGASGSRSTPSQPAT